MPNYLGGLKNIFGRLKPPKIGLTTPLVLVLSDSILECRSRPD